MTILAVLLATLVFALAGDLVGALLAPGLRDDRAGRWGIALVLGPPAVAFMCFAINLAGVPLASGLSFALAGGIVAISLWSRLRRPSGFEGLTPARGVASFDGRGIRGVAWAVIFGSALLGFVFTLAIPPYKDSIVNWSYKTLILWRDGTVFTADFTAPDRHVYHPNYPLAIPLAQVFVYGLAGEPLDRAARALLALPHLGCALVVFAALRRRLDATLALVFAALVAAIPHFYKADVQFRFAGSVPSGYADPLYAALTTLAFVATATWFDTRRSGDLALASASLGLAIFTKNEAIPFTIAYGAGFAWAVFVMRKRLDFGALARQSLTAAVIALAIALPWFLYRHGIPERDENYQDLLTVKHLAEGSWRYAIVAVAAVQSFFATDNYALAWPLLALAIVFRPGAGRDPTVQCGLVIVTLMACVYAAVFVVTPLPIVDSLTTSIPRTFFHLTPIAIVVAGHLSKPAALDEDAGERAG